ncbi:hypothetical protein HPB49_008333 [Dermacentor silvarum]|uniref:Uncharacterized protein n=1 Tax=Dermacentor silvarum TaxID=543639 RepID=A0ACB8C8A8_DERSI|nr:hypothetical protein HPB49_008333 [Dermacentor silvarum]
MLVPKAAFYRELSDLWGSSRMDTLFPTQWAQPYNQEALGYELPVQDSVVAMVPIIGSLDLKEHGLDISIVVLIFFRGFLLAISELAFLTSLFRKKRDLSSPATKPRTVTLRHDEADAHIEQLFEVLEANDPSDCFKRAICQLEAAKHQRTLSDLEQFFVGLFG